MAFSSTTESWSDDNPYFRVGCSTFCEKRSIYTSLLSSEGDEYDYACRHYKNCDFCITGGQYGSTQMTSDLDANDDEDEESKAKSTIQKKVRK